MNVRFVPQTALPKPGGGKTVGWRSNGHSTALYGGQTHLPNMRSTKRAKAPARWDGLALARRLRLDSGQFSALNNCLLRARPEKGPRP